MPDIRVGAANSLEVPKRIGFWRRTAEGPQTAGLRSNATERLGGVPFGLPNALWPKCEECGKSQSLLAQFVHHPDRLDLGRDGRSLFVFHCNHDPGMCSDWEATSGANACIVIDREILQNTATPLPSDNPPIDDEVIIAGWIEKDDGLTIEETSRFMSEESLISLDESVLTKATASTKLGGVPYWIQSPDEAPKFGWTFLGQLDSTYSFLTVPIESRNWISKDRHGFEGRTHVGRGPNFGDGGVAYLFIQRNVDPPKVCMFWQCT
ncbi:MAG: hypothetical protein HY243_17235 [Proteobacteria bacterium]|nr:hypothetical protein [Pseudomonadota bacterium]